MRAQISRMNHENDIALAPGPCARGRVLALDKVGPLQTKVSAQPPGSLESQKQPVCQGQITVVGYLPGAYRHRQQVVCPPTPTACVQSLNGLATGRGLRGVDVSSAGAEA